ncbi:MAG: SGNH/GDSL hydrolase family protein, partial [Hyphomicrobiaceae bacterium]
MARSLRQKPNAWLLGADMLLRLTSIIGALLLSAASIAMTLTALELLVFRTILVPDDLLPNVTIDSVVRYEPNRVAVFRHPDGSRTTVRINAQGWNATRPSYDIERAENVLRVAVVGDSYVHGGFLELEHNVPHRLEIALRAQGREAEVYQFGMDGAPLSQYLHMLRVEVLKYRPDVVVIPLIHNDFDEMYRGLRTRYASAFLKLARSDCGSVIEVPPAEFKPGLADRLRQF